MIMQTIGCFARKHELLRHLTVSVISGCRLCRCKCKRCSRTQDDRSESHSLLPKMRMANSSLYSPFTIAMRSLLLVRCTVTAWTRATTGIGCTALDVGQQRRLRAHHFGQRTPGADLVTPHGHARRR